MVIERLLVSPETVTAVPANNVILDEREMVMSLLLAGAVSLYEISVVRNCEDSDPLSTSP